MSISDDTKLDTCGCCEGIMPRTPRYNRPRKPAIDYRLDTHTMFLRRMITRLHTQSILEGKNAGDRPLTALTTRATDDPAIAIMDAWAVVADVLTFYQERIANECFLDTATERRSALELASAIGYELKPGVAASTYLAFTLDDAPGSPGHATIGEGTRVMSIPGQDEEPQTFETIEEIEARAEWNALKPRMTVPQEIDRGTDRIYLKGTDTQLQPGDAILIVGDHRVQWAGSERWDFRIVQTVTRYDKEKYTLVTWEECIGHDAPTIEPADNPRVFAFRRRAALFGHNAPDWRAMSEEIKKAYDPEGKQRTRWPDFEIQTTAKRLIDLDAVYPTILEGSWIVLTKPKYVELYKALKVVADSRTDFTLTSKVTRIELDTREHLSWFGLRDTVVFAQSEELDLADNPLDTPVFGNRIVIDQTVENPEQEHILVVSGVLLRRVKVAERSRVIKVGKDEVIQTEVDLFIVSADGSEKVKLEPGDELEIVEPPSSFGDGRIRWHLRDEKGFAGFVTADQGDFIPADLQKADDLTTTQEDETVSEVMVIGRTESDSDSTTLIFTSELQNIYKRDTVTINANVARATHGETVYEVLGSGSAAEANQRFELKKPPLTYVSASTPSGTLSTLTVRANALQWQEAASLYGLDTRSQSYIVRIDDDAATNLVFGDGKNGARLPTGVENITAVYRSGIGLEGEVGAGSLTLLMTRPLGVRGVTNPLPASGAESPENLSDARQNAPVTVLTLDRIVSLRDFENLARSFAGIGKAQASALKMGQSHVVHITVAAANGSEVDSESKEDLCDAIDLVRDPIERVYIDSFRLRTFTIEADILIDERHLADDVLAEVRATLKDSFSFENRDFGQPVTAAEVLSIMQAVDGVVAVDLNKLEPDAASMAVHESVSPTTILPSGDARVDDGTILPAELLLLNTDTEGVTLTELKI
ncbi:MAG: putative baseplate assembly protein [Candidatus Methanogaster sp.]|uniref:Baseplate assembly protein n=1 Tax=Candidatus Methanogaster sp. TaxID=3386292 RepID=A0AC61KZR3_9EURY|nr:MAG: putative baseplate assembly protein [ANME-2 cluster archaeon]